MQLRRSDLADLSYFLEIGKHRNFRRAALELDISASALSHRCAAWKSVLECAF